MRHFTSDDTGQCQNGFVKPPYSILRATSIDSECCPLPTANVLSNKQSGSITLQSVLVKTPKFLKATRDAEIWKIEIPRSMVAVKALSWRSRIIVCNIVLHHCIFQSVYVIILCIEDLQFVRRKECQDFERSPSQLKPFQKRQMASCPWWENLPQNIKEGVLLYLLQVKTRTWSPTYIDSTMVQAFLSLKTLQQSRFTAPDVFVISI